LTLSTIAYYISDPGEWDWYAMWMIEKMDRTHIGNLCSKGSVQMGKLVRKAPDIKFAGEMG